MAPKRKMAGGIDGSTEKQPKNIDKYCWLCHTDNTNVFCSKCIRSYHSHCIGSKAKRAQLANFKCDMCTKADRAKNDYAKRNVDVQHINVLLGYVTKRVFDGDDFKRFYHGYYDENTSNSIIDSIVNAIDLQTIEEKVNNCEYETALDYLNDIRWIRHNVSVVPSGNNSGDLQAVKYLEKFCKKEVYDIEMCAECFHHSNNQNDWFTKVCDPPHLLIWARINSHYPYKPAKVIGIGTTAAKKLDVRFFGGNHPMADVSPSDCYLFSREHPNEKCDDKTRMELLHSFEEVDKYVRNIESKYASTILKSERKTKLDVNKFGEHLRTMIPNLELPANFALKRKPTYLNSVMRSRIVVPRPSNGRSKAKRTNHTAKSVSSLPELRIVIEKCDRLVNYYRRAAKRETDYIAIKQEIDGNNDAEDSDAEESDAETVVLDFDEECGQSENEVAAPTVLEKLEIEINTDEIWAFENGFETSEAEHTKIDENRNNEHLSTFLVNENEDNFQVENAADQVNQLKSPSHEQNEEEVQDEEITTKAPASETEEIPMNAAPAPTEICSLSAQTEAPVQVSNEAETHETAQTAPPEDPLAISTVHDVNGLLQIALQTLEDTTRRKHDKLESLRNELKMQTEAFNEFKSETSATISALKLEVALLTKTLNDKQMEMDIQMKQHEIELQNRIEETKSKSWCIVCKKEAACKFGFSPPLCSMTCIQIYWNQNEQPNERPLANAMEPSDNEDQPILNDVQLNANNSGVSESESLSDLLTAELHLFDRFASY